MKTKFPFTAMILAGGKSSRMGQDKALLKFGEKTLLENLIALVAPLFKETLVIVDRRTKLEELDLRQAKVYEDLIRKRGPLAALYTGLQYSSSTASAVFTCDMPFIDALIIRDLVGFWEVGFDAVCLEEAEGRYEPFPGIYLRSTRHLIRSLLDKGRDSMQGFLGVAMVKPLVLQKERIRVLTNVNYIEDYYRVLKEKEESYEENEG